MSCRAVVLHLRFVPEGTSSHFPRSSPGNFAPVSSEALSRFCAEISPRWSLESRGALIEFTGLERLWGYGPDGPGLVCRRATTHFGPVWGGTGPGELSARLASLLAWRLAPEPCVLMVPRGSVRAFLASFPVAVLKDHPAAVQRLQSLGIRSLGDLQVVPPDLLRAVFGDEAAGLRACAEGSDFPFLAGPEARPSGLECLARASWSRPLTSPAGLAALKEGLVLRCLARCPDGPASRPCWVLQARLAQGTRRVRGSSGAPATRDGWRSLIEGLLAKLALARCGLLGLSLWAAPQESRTLEQGNLFPAASRPLMLARALGKINARRPGSISSASENLLVRWGVRWAGTESEAASPVVDADAGEK